MDSSPFFPNSLVNIGAGAPTKRDGVVYEVPVLPAKAKEGFTFLG